MVFIRLLALFLASLLSTDVFAAAADPLIPDHHHWTVKQCEKYWTARAKTVWVIKSVGGTPVAADDESRDPEKFVVEQNAQGSAPGTPASGGLVTVVLKSPVGLKKVRQVEFGGGATKLGSMNAHYAPYAPASPQNVRLCWSKVGEAEELNAYSSDMSTRQCKTYQAPWVDNGPIYEGGSVGVVINGSVYDLVVKYWWAVLLVFGALAIIGWRRLKK